MTLRWSEAASFDLLDIYDFIADDRPESAPAVTERLVRAAERLQIHPMLGRAGKEPGTRELVLPPYIIIYRIVDDVVSIEAVLHGKQQPS